jgi:hypothetical protein
MSLRVEKEYKMTETRFFEEEQGLSALKSAVFQAHKKKSVHRFATSVGGR